MRGGCFLSKYVQDNLEAVQSELAADTVVDVKKKKRKDGQHES